LTRFTLEFSSNECHISNNENHVSNLWGAVMADVEVRPVEESTVDVLDLVVADELLVEEVSIDGMCGVY
jgi:mycofactocin precursor